MPLHHWKSYNVTSLWKAGKIPGQIKPHSVHIAVLKLYHENITGSRRALMVLSVHTGLQDQCFECWQSPATSCQAADPVHQAHSLAHFSTTFGSQSSAIIIHMPFEHHMFLYDIWAIYFPHRNKSCCFKHDNKLQLREKVLSSRFHSRQYESTHKQVLYYRHLHKNYWLNLHSKHHQYEMKGGGSYICIHKRQLWVIISTTHIIKQGWILQASTCILCMLKNYIPYPIC
jgi:hypothetical protein